MQKIFPPGTKVKVGLGFTQEIATMDKVYTVVRHKTGMATIPWAVYVVRDGNGVEREFMDHLLEETQEPPTVGATLMELLAAPYGTKGFSPYDDTVLRRDVHGWVTSARTRHPLSEDELASYLPVYLVGEWS